jgi:hypothetical protein
VDVSGYHGAAFGPQFPYATSVCDVFSSSCVPGLHGAFDSQAFKNCDRRRRRLIRLREMESALNLPGWFDRHIISTPARDIRNVIRPTAAFALMASFRLLKTEPLYILRISLLFYLD